MSIVSRTALTAWTAVWLGTASLMTACASPGLFGRPADESGDAQNELGAPARLGTADLSVYLELMRDLVEGDAVAQADTMRRVETAAEDAPTTTNRLKLALALGTPGHPGSDPERAAGLLNELLASGAALLPEERMLVAVHLKEVEQRLILDAEVEQLRHDSQDALAAQDDENRRRLEAATAENARLRKALKEAEEKLNAITNIERSIRERENGANTN